MTSQYDNFYDLEDGSDELREQVRKRAKESVLSMELPDKIFLPEKLNTLGNKLNVFYRHQKEELQGKLVGNFEETIAYSNSLFWIAAYREAHYHRYLMAKWRTPLSEFQIQQTTAQGSADSSGWCATICNHTMYLSVDAELKELGLSEQIVLAAAALYWLSLADSCDIQEEKYDLITEAFNAINSSQGSDMWNYGEENILRQKSDMMREAAKKRWLNDPTQAALTAISKHYEEKKSKFKLRGFTAQFVREMHATYPVITSIKTIENLVAKLNANNELIPR